MGLLEQRVNTSFPEKKVGTAGSVLAMRLSCGGEKLQAAGVPGPVSLGLSSPHRALASPQQAIYTISKTRGAKPEGRFVQCDHTGERNREVQGSPQVT